jgi:translation initiation factor eIF-2B subunit alpha
MPSCCFLHSFPSSYKFHRLFPLSQYDLPTHNENILALPYATQGTPMSTGQLPPPAVHSPNHLRTVPVAPALTPEQILKNPNVDYTRYAHEIQHNTSCVYPGSSRPDLISLVFSDVGPLTPEGVSQYLVGMFAG